MAEEDFANVKGAALIIEMQSWVALPITMLMQIGLQE